jgi:hypothetical protein
MKLVFHQSKAVNIVPIHQYVLSVIMDNKNNV